jgi:ribosome-associated protein
MQYVGKLMRKLTPEQVAAVKQALDEQRNGSASEKCRCRWPSNGATA